jgi:hypothetical protein
MESLLGFHLTFWDYATFAAIVVMIAGFLAAVVFILGLPGRIAIAATITRLLDDRNTALRHR